MTSDYMQCSVINAKHYNGPVIKDFKIQHVRDNFSIYVEDLNKMPEVIQLIQRYEKITYQELNKISPAYAQDIFNSAKNCEKVLSKNGDVNLTFIGRTNEAMEKEYALQGKLRQAEYPTLSMRFDIQDHGFIEQHYIKKTAAFISNAWQNLDEIYTFHEEFGQRLQKRIAVHTVNYPVGIAHPISHIIKKDWNLQQIRCFDIMRAINSA